MDAIFTVVDRGIGERWAGGSKVFGVWGWRLRKSNQICPSTLKLAANGSSQHCNL